MACIDSWIRRVYFEHALKLALSWIVRTVLQSGQGTFDADKLHRHGIDMSDGSCGLVVPFLPKGAAAAEKDVPAFDANTLFSEAESCMGCILVVPPVAGSPSLS